MPGTPEKRASDPELRREISEHDAKAASDLAALARYVERRIEASERKVEAKIDAAADPQNVALERITANTAVRWHELPVVRSIAVVAGTAAGAALWEFLSRLAK